MIGNGFARRRKGQIAFYCCIAFEGLDRVRHGFSTRGGGAISPQGSSLNLGLVPWDTRERVAGNRRLFLDALGLPGAQLATLSQIHSDQVHIVGESDGQKDRPLEGDALITRDTGVALGVLVADCFPVLLADPRSGAVAAVHSGWRGTASRVLEKTVAMMQTTFAVEASRMLAAIGPGIRSCCFEVGLDVAEQFGQVWPDSCLHPRPSDRPGKAFLDLPRVLEIQLVAAGLHTGNIFDLGLCTRCNPDEFFSHRAEGANAGRLMATIGTIDG